MSFEFILCNVYFQPNCNYTNVIGNFYNNLTSVNESFANTPLLIGGDFNFRVGNLNSHVELLKYTAFDCTRVFLDGTLSTNARKLVENLETFNLILLNGRSLNDKPANYTYLSSLGKSVIDLVWASFDCFHLIQDLKILHITTRSDHFPVCIELALPPINLLSLPE